MIWKKGVLMAVGSTQGSGAAFGEEACSEGQKENGFVTKIDPIRRTINAGNKEETHSLGRPTHLTITKGGGYGVGTREVNVLYLI